MLKRPSDLEISNTNPITSNESFSTQSKSCSSLKNLSPLLLAKCVRCNIPFADDEIFVNTESKTWHLECFRCVQCFCLLHNELHYVIDGRNYCEYDFKVLYAPSCAKCDEFISGRVIRAANSNWHPKCLECNQCGKWLENDCVWFKNSQILCQNCNKLAKMGNEKRCAKCNAIIEHGTELQYQDNIYHSYHFCCENCRKELDGNARCLKDKFYCQHCYDHQCASICGACRHPIENEKSIFALGKYWHIDHFLCAKCEKPFYGNKSIEKNGRAYCYSCYGKCFADICFKCNGILMGSSLKVFGKCWCPKCYTCSTCDTILNHRSKVIEWDMRPICKKCFDYFPKEIKHRMIQ
ncbi:hypothetical protein LOAG_03488 [Loa loa]|uniref:LIM zinc-binding domain-containing protein n=1 Tax=Loa loa TaxID=7209 RepID=A0A1S0U413_LOALO|nr:hypothetical protein LOAG_03488 [Loa loa]EFO24994.2 hypothetical protein LOAG_03488 [Loa loa]